MPFPRNRKELENAGYSFSHKKECASCRVQIEMWNTPSARMMPMDFKFDEHGNEVCESHFATCKDPAQYSQRLREKKKKAEAAEAGPITPDA